jgi:hypothetical protein
MSSRNLSRKDEMTKLNKFRTTDAKLQKKKTQKVLALNRRLKYNEKFPTFEISFFYCACIPSLCEIN